MPARGRVGEIRGMDMADNRKGFARRAGRAALLAGSSGFVLAFLSSTLPAPSLATDVAADPSIQSAGEICDSYGEDSPECLAALLSLAPGTGISSGRPGERGGEGGTGSSNGGSSGGSVRPG